tara:strand:+ start:109 stop:804 length:696 start_codon:yes stop_codon:yes gene_type:complete
VNLALFPRVVPPAPAGIDLRCCGVDDLLPTLEAESFDLVVADPPWTYTHTCGQGDQPSDQYKCLSMEEIRKHLAVTAAAAKLSARLLVWATWPKLTEWQEEARRMREWTYKTGGSWHKQRRSPGIGYHLLGASEPFLIYTKDGGCFTNSQELTHNAHQSIPGTHSEKPVDYYRLLLRRWVPPGGRVLEIYAGLGPLARACHAEGVQYVGCEIDPDRHATALTRLRQGVGVS